MQNQLVHMVFSAELEKEDQLPPTKRWPAQHRVESCEPTGLKGQATESCVHANRANEPSFACVVRHHSVDRVTGCTGGQGENTGCSTVRSTSSSAQSWEARRPEELLPTQLHSSTKSPLNPRLTSLRMQPTPWKRWQSMERCHGAQAIQSVSPGYYFSCFY